MRRSKWKGSFVDKSILKLKKKRTNKKPFKIWSRRSVIPNFLVGLNVMVHNGKEFKRLEITRSKVGYKFGEFIATRKYVQKFNK